jgi:hypothetical protein
VFFPPPKAKFNPSVSPLPSRGSGTGGGLVDGNSNHIRKSLEVLLRLTALNQSLAGVDEAGRLGAQ